MPTGASTVADDTIVYLAVTSDLDSKCLRKDLDGEKLGRWPYIHKNAMLYQLQETSTGTLYNMIIHCMTMF